MIGEWKKLNWASITLSAGMIGLEFGYLFAYRSGGKVSGTALLVNICTAAVLMAVGALWFREGVHMRQLAGLFVSVIGLYIMNH